MHQDDEQVGRVLSRREALALLGVAGVSVLGASAGFGGPRRRAAPAVAGVGGAGGGRRIARLPSCVVRPAQTEGPYFVDEELDRSDIRSDPTDGSVSEGAPLELAFQVSRVAAAGCVPLAGALVDVWQCDALGVYSDVHDIGDRFDTVGKKFLRGHQRTDADGVARFTTIYPGWYEGRTVHIHFKIRTEGSSGRGHEFTSQLYFDDALTDRVLRREPYASRGPRSTRNRQDGIFRRGGEQLMLAVAEKGPGYAGTFDVGLQME